MGKRRRDKRKRQTESDVIYVLHYEITYEPMEEEEYRQLPHSVKEQLRRLNIEVQRKPEKVLPELLELKAKYPQVPQIYNFLTVAYAKMGKLEEAEKTARECVARNPDYLFGRINLAEFYLMRGEYEKIPELFNHKYDLKLLYPERERFHISEVASFMGVMGLYFAATNQWEIADRYNQVLQEIAPEFPIAKRLKRKLNPDLKWLQHLEEQEKKE